MPMFYYIKVNKVVLVPDSFWKTFKIMKLNLFPLVCQSFTSQLKENSIQVLGPVCVLAMPSTNQICHDIIRRGSRVICHMPFMAQVTGLETTWQEYFKLAASSASRAIVHDMNGNANRYLFPGIIELLA